MSLQDVKPGDIVTRNLCGAKMRLKITDITGDVISCGPWTFSKTTGAEIDEELGWDGKTMSGSYIYVESLGDWSAKQGQD